MSRSGRFTHAARAARVADAAAALLELAAAREQLTADLGVLPFDHAHGRPRTTLSGQHYLLDAHDDEPTDITPAWLRPDWEAEVSL